MTPLPDTALIVGASRGVGHAMVRQLIERGVRKIYCGSRGAPVRLDDLASRYDSDVTWLRLDLEDEQSIEDAAKVIGDSSSELPWIINTAGLLHDGDLQPERRLSDVDRGNVMRLFAVNSLGPLLLVRHMAHLLPRNAPCVVASLSARVGSIGDNRLGGWYGYRASKAAQNMLVKTLSIELKRRHARVRCVALHPGTVKTALSEPFRGRVPDDKLFEAETSAGHLLKVLEALDDEDNGKFFAWDGQEIPW